MTVSDKTIVVGEDKLDDTQDAYSDLAGCIKSKWETARTSRQTHENRWLAAYRNYRGKYDQETLSRIEGDKSKVFVKITKLKVLAAYGQILEVLLNEGRFPIEVRPTEKPINISEYAHLDPNNPTAPDAKDATEEDLYGYNGDGRTLEPGDTAQTIRARLGGLVKKFASATATLIDGPPDNGATQPTIKPAEMAARNMNKLIQDQLTECDAADALKRMVFEMCLLGHGVMKGPFTMEKTYHKWENGQYVPIIRDVPVFKDVSIWNVYPDPEAKCIKDCDYFIERHILNAAQVRALKDRPGFIKEALREVLEKGPNHMPEWFESQIRETPENFAKERYEILEYWGVANKEQLKEYDLDAELSELGDLDDLDDVSVNVWLCGNIVVRVVLNPFTPSRIPYLDSPYEINPYDFFGIGVPENMEDAQQIMNGHTRMAVDNLKLAGNVMIDLDENLLVPGQDMSIYAGKVWRRQGGQGGQALFPIKFPSTAQENMMMYDKARSLADEETGITSVSHGQSGFQTGVRSASQTSMLMGAAALSIKTVVSNIDSGILEPMGEAIFHWNMQFNYENCPEAIGDLEVKALGVSSFTQRDVKAQRLNQFMQLGLNPMIAPMINWTSLLRDQAKVLDLDPDDLINDPQQAAIMAHVMGMVNGQQQQQGPPSGAPLAPPLPGDPSNSAANNPNPNQNPQAGNGQATSAAPSGAGQPPGMG